MPPRVTIAARPRGHFTQLAAFRAWPAASLVLALACWQSAAQGVDDQFPYKAYITADEVDVRSGPGEKYYPALKLGRGEAVEVYRHDPGGWYAIRPPEGSFSWVSAEFLEAGDDGTAVVAGDRVVARVGSAFSDTRDVIQVRLDRGEKVTLLEARPFHTGAAAQTWYKIAPPAGEFRWVSGRFVDRELEKPRRRPGPRNNLLIAKHGFEPEEAGDTAAADDDDGAAGEPDDDWQAEDEDDAAGDDDSGAAGLLPVDYDEPLDHDEPLDDDEPLPEDAADGEEAEPAGRWSKAAEDEPTADGPKLRAGDRPEQGDPRPRVAPRSKGPAGLKDELEDIDLAVSAIVAEEPTAWDFDNVRQRAEALLERSRTALERGRARRMLRKIDQFAELRERYETVMGLRAETDERDQPLIETANGVDAAAPSRPDPRYDGHGRLTQVVSRQPSAPQFALLNEAGEVLYYVSPAPGLNLRPYLNREVGITGTLGYLPEHRARHVTAKRVEAVEGRVAGKGREADEATR
ncbi:MAG: hypothetical protein WD847_19335 [Pirellulales bacterium]